MVVRQRGVISVLDNSRLGVGSVRGGVVVNNNNIPRRVARVQCDRQRWRPCRTFSPLRHPATLMTPPQVISPKVTRLCQFPASRSRRCPISRDNSGGGGGDLVTAPMKRKQHEDDDGTQTLKLGMEKCHSGWVKLD